MKRVVLLLVLLAAATAITASNVLEPTVDAYLVEVSIAPSARDRIQLLDRQTPFTYTCHAVVRDAATKAPIGMVKAIVAQGGSETVTQKNLGWTTTLTVKLSRRAQRAETEVVVKKNDKIVNHQIASVQLQNVDPGIVPLR